MRVFFGVLVGVDGWVFRSSLFGDRMLFVFGDMLATGLIGLPHD